MRKGWWIVFFVLIVAGLAWGGGRLLWRSLLALHGR
jgi:hypothetical protein